jgi:DNA-binding protein H-NS
MKYLLILPLLLCSCVSQADLFKVQDASQRFQQETFQALKELQEGSISDEEAEKRIEEAVDERDEAYDAVFEDIAQRIDAIKEVSGKIPTDPESLLILGGSLLATAMGVDKYRDRKRKGRQEPV